MNPINKKHNSSYNFVAPDIEDDADRKIEPLFPTSEVVTPAVVSNEATVKIRRQHTIIKLGTLSAATTLTFQPEAKNLNIGAMVMVSWTSDGTTRNITVKIGNDTVATLAGTASTKVNKQLVWDGESFLAI